MLCWLVVFPLTSPLTSNMQYAPQFWADTEVLVGGGGVTDFELELYLEGFIATRIDGVNNQAEGLYGGLASSHHDPM